MSRSGGYAILEYALERHDGALSDPLECILPLSNNDLSRALESARALSLL
jgi:hypothetical protein